MQQLRKCQIKLRAFTGSNIHIHGGIEVYVEEANNKNEIDCC